VSVRHQRPSPRLEIHSQAVIRCVVCAKRIRLDDEVIEIHHAGTAHRFCCPSCAAKFEAAPENYIIHS
jgi:YHS domain-containing protein